MRVLEMSKYARVPGECQIIALLWRRGLSTLDGDDMRWIDQGSFSL